MTDEVLKFFVLFFVVVEPISLVPLFAALTEGADDAFRRRMALKAVLLSGTMFLLFAVGGTWFLRVMGISIEAFRIAGGIMLFLIALEMVFARESGTRQTSKERVVWMRPGPGSSRSMTSPRLTRSNRQPAFGFTVREAMDTGR